MAQARKKVVIRRFTEEVLFGYLPPSRFLQASPGHQAPAVDLLDLSGRSSPLPLAGIKLIHYVRDFNLDDPLNPERLSRRAFLGRPRSEGLWLRITFPAGDQMEGLAPLDLSLLDSAVEDAGLFLTPPDDRTNTHRIYVPRIAITELQILAVITTPKRHRPAVFKPESQQSLFP